MVRNRRESIHHLSRIRCCLRPARIPLASAHGSTARCSWPAVTSVLAEARALAEALVVAIDVGEPRLVGRNRSPALDRQTDGDVCKGELCPADVAPRANCAST